MRRVRYNVAVSLDGYIADAAGRFDWIIMDPAIDFAALFAQFDTVLMGRQTFEVVRAQATGGATPDLRTLVFSRTLRAADYPDVTIVADDATGTVAALRTRPGKDIWLMGGGMLFRDLLVAGQVDSVEVAVIPVLLGQGISMLASPLPHDVKLRLTHSEALSTGIVMSRYDVVRT